jgi:hypothetical protein
VTLGAIWAFFDFLIRLAFFAAVPLLLVFFMAVFPITAAMANIGLMLGVFAVRELVRGQANRHPVLRHILRRHLRFEEYYRQHPPRPFLYYMFYPLLFPYWLLNRDARREFLLYRGYTIFGLLVLFGIGAYQYLALWRPEIPFGVFLRAMAFAYLVVQSVVMLAFLMPIATTVVTMTIYHQRKRLAALLVVAVASATFAFVAMRRSETKHHDVVSFSTRVRLINRMLAAPQRAEQAVHEALAAAWGKKDDILSSLGDNGRLIGDPLERAHAELEKFFREDEAHAFAMAGYPAVAPRILVLFFWIRGMPSPIWEAMDNLGRPISHKVAIPDDMRAAMKQLSPR